jgi:hypothetical protein
MKIAIPDDYQNVALKMADWAALSGRAEITVFNGDALWRDADSHGELFGHLRRCCHTQFRPKMRASALDNKVRLLHYAKYFVSTELSEILTFGRS